MHAPSSYARLRSGKTLLLSLTLAAVAALAATAFGVLARPAGPTPLRPPQEAPQEAAPAEARAEVFTLTPAGFEPAEATLPAGEYLLVFNNRAGLDEFELRVEREGGGRSEEARVSRGRRVLRQMRRLTPGIYVITEASHPEWTLRLTVTSR